MEANVPKSYKQSSLGWKIMSQKVMTNAPWCQMVESLQLTQMLPRDTFVLLLHCA